MRGNSYNDNHDSDSDYYCYNDHNDLLRQGYLVSCKNGFIDERPVCFVSYVEERPWWPIKSFNKGRKKEAKG